MFLKHYERKHFNQVAADAFGGFSFYCKKFLRSYLQNPLLFNVLDVDDTNASEP